MKISVLGESSSTGKDWCRHSRTTDKEGGMDSHMVRPVQGRIRVLLSCMKASLVQHHRFNWKPTLADSMAALPKCALKNSHILLGMCLGQAPSSLDYYDNGLFIGFANQGQGVASLCWISLGWGGASLGVPAAISTISFLSPSRDHVFCSFFWF